MDIISITRANCAQPMNYYASLAVVLTGLALALASLLCLPWLWSLLARSSCRPVEMLSSRRVARKISTLEDKLQRQGVRRSIVARELQTATASIQAEARIPGLCWHGFVAHQGACVLGHASLLAVLAGDEGIVDDSVSLVVHAAVRCVSR